MGREFRQVEDVTVTVQRMSVAVLQFPWELSFEFFSFCNHRIGGGCGCVACRSRDTTKNNARICLSVLRVKPQFPSRKWYILGVSISHLLTLR